MSIQEKVTNTSTQGNHQASKKVWKSPAGLIYNKIKKATKLYIQ